MVEWVTLLAIAVVGAAIFGLFRGRAGPSRLTFEFLKVYWYCTIDQLEALIRGGADVNGVIQSNAPGGWSRPLHGLAGRGDDVQNLTRIRILLRNGAYVDSLDSVGRTPLASMIESFSASQSGGKVASLLISQGAKIDHVNEWGAALLHTAASRRDSVIQPLLDAGADINAQAPLTSAFVLSGDFSAVDTDGRERRTTQGASPLHFAAAHCSVEAARVLLKNGANANARTAEGITPLAIIEARTARYNENIANGETYQDGYKESLDAVKALIVSHARD